MSGYIGSKASVVTPGAERKKVFAITTTTTSLTGLNYTVGFVHVFHNGIRLVDGTDYTATNGTSITLTNAALNGDEVVVISYASFQTSDTVSASAGGTFSNPITIDGNGATVITADRATSDGSIVDFKKDGTTVGSIGAKDSNVFIGTGNTGVRFSSGTNSVFPIDTSVGNGRDAAIDLGLGAGGRFKDLYLSGGVYLGGTGAANKLDDYETGTWTPTLVGVTGITYLEQTGSYTKVGNLVHCSFQLRATFTASGNSSIGNLPFTSANNSNYYGTGGFFTLQDAENGITPSLYVQPNQSVAGLWELNNMANWALPSGSGRYLNGVITYRTS